MSERDLRPAERVSDELLGGLLNRSWKIEQMTSRGPKKNFTFETGLAVHLMLDLQDARAEIATLQRAHDPGCDACDPLTAHVRIAELVDERDEARRLVVGTAMHGSKCAYCGALIKIEDMNNFDGIALLLRRHLAKCPKHPMRAVEAERDRLRAALEPLIETAVSYAMQTYDRSGVTRRKIEAARAALSQKDWHCNVCGCGGTPGTEDMHGKICAGTPIEAKP